MPKEQLERIKGDAERAIAQHPNWPVVTIPTPPLLTDEKATMNELHRRIAEILLPFVPAPQRVYVLRDILEAIRKWRLEPVNQSH